MASTLTSYLVHTSGQEGGVLATREVLADYRPKLGYWVRLKSNIDGTTYTSTAQTDATGKFTITGVPDGSYKVQTSLVNPLPAGVDWPSTGDGNFIMPTGGGGASQTPVTTGAGATVIDANGNAAFNSTISNLYFSALAGGGCISQSSGVPTLPGSVNPVAGDTNWRTDGIVPALYGCTVGGASPTWIPMLGVGGSVLVNAAAGWATTLARFQVNGTDVLTIDNNGSVIAYSLYSTNGSLVSTTGALQVSTSWGGAFPAVFTNTALTLGASTNLLAKPGFGIDTDSAGTLNIGVTNATGITLGKAAVLTNFGNTLVANGGGAAPTFATIGGSGPTTAAQAGWLAIKIAGTNSWIPIWR